MHGLWLRRDFLKLYGTRVSLSASPRSLARFEGVSPANSQPSSIPPVTVLTGAVDIASGYYSTCALLNDKTVRCWGRNNVGQLADGTYTNRNLPQQVSSFTNVAKVSVGGYHACIVLEDKTMRCWGENGDGRLGDVTLTGNVNQFTPRVVTGLSNAHDLTLGWSHSCMLSDANDVYCWGYNNRAQLGSVLSDYRSNVPGTVISRYTQEY